jgi:hypothetical protein
MAGSITINGSFKPDARQWKKINNELLVYFNQAAINIAETIKSFSERIIDQIVNNGTFFENCKLVEYLNKKFNSNKNNIKNKQKYEQIIKKIPTELKNFYNKNKKNIISIKVGKTKNIQALKSLNGYDILKFSAGSYFQRTEELANILKDTEIQIAQILEQDIPKWAQKKKTRKKDVLNEARKSDKINIKKQEFSDIKKIKRIIEDQKITDIRDITETMNDLFAKTDYSTINRLGEFQNVGEDTYTENYIKKLIGKYNLLPEIKKIDNIPYSEDLENIEDFPQGIEGLNDEDMQESIETLEEIELIEGINAPLIDRENALRKLERESIDDLRISLKKFGIKEEMINKLLFSSEIYTLIDPSQAEIFIRKDHSTGGESLSIKRGSMNQDEIKETIKQLEDGIKHNITLLNKGHIGADIILDPIVKGRASLKIYKALLKSGGVDYNKMFNELFPYMNIKDINYDYNEEYSRSRAILPSTSKIKETAEEKLIEEKEMSLTDEEAKALLANEFFKSEFARIKMIKDALDPFKEIFDIFKEKYEVSLMSLFERELTKELAKDNFNPFL